MATVSQEDADKLVKILAQYGNKDSKVAAQKVVDAGGIEAAKKTLPPKTSAATPRPVTPQKDTSISDAVGSSLPAAENRSSLVEFADTLNKATSLARDRRQASELGILEDYGFKPGQVRAGTMGSVLNLLQSRADTSYGTLQNAAVAAYENEEKRKAADVQNRQSLALQLLTSGKLDETGVAGIINAPDFNSALSAAAGMIKANNTDVEDIRTIDNKIVAIKSDGSTEVIYEGDGTGDTFTLGTNQVRYDAEGNVIAYGPSSKSSTDTEKPIVSGGLTTTKAFIGQAGSTLEQSRGSDGWVNSATYAQMAQDWQADGGLLADFLKLFPPKNYTNPDDDSLPSYLRDKNSSSDSGSNPFK